MNFSWSLFLGLLVFLSLMMTKFSDAWYKKSLKYGYLTIACLLAFYISLFLVLIIQKNAVGAGGILVIGAAIILNETQKVISDNRMDEYLRKQSMSKTIK